MKCLDNRIFSYLIKQTAHRFQHGRSAIICLAFIAVFLLSGGLNLPILRAETQAVDRSDIIAQIEQARSLVAKDRFEQAIERLVTAYNLADSRQDYLASAALTYLIGESMNKAAVPSRP